MSMMPENKSASVRKNNLNVILAVIFWDDITGCLDFSS